MVTDVHSDYEHCRIAADYIESRIHIEPRMGVMLGSGLGPLAENIQIDTVIDYKDIPYFPQSTVSTHAGNLIAGTLSGVPVLCMNGRFHYYEGYSFEDLAMPVRVLWLLGIQCLLVTNAAGAVNITYRPGDIMIISDHINLTGFNPVIGQNYREFGDRFYDVSDLYTEKLRAIARKCAKRSELTVHEGTYMFFPGPNYETAAEIRAARLLGADAVGMSTVPEALTAGHIGLPVIGISVITNMGTGVLPEKITDEDVNIISNMVSIDFSAFVDDMIRSMVEEYRKEKAEDETAEKKTP